METDVVLRSPTKAIIIDTKYYQHTLSGQFDQGKFRFTHLCQLFAYLKNAQAMDAVYKEAEGMLLYPTVQQALDESFMVQGHRMRICTVNLAQPWQGIHDDLLGLIG
jgi:5-methylcytosine-specific restriction enzyme subunit McrC